MFAKPRVKKSILPSHYKKRKTTSDIEEISFDNDARHEFLTGFHKRKQQRIKHAQDIAAKRARQEKLDTRKQIRDDRKRELEEHVANVNRMLRESQAANSGDIEAAEDNDDEEWDGIADEPNLDIIDHQEEYVDEDRYTTVTVESVVISRDGLAKPELVDEDDTASTEVIEENADEREPSSRKKDHDRPRKKKKQFRYESKFERSLTNAKQRVKKMKRGV
ncbi:hypothetical protein VHEMI10056 [[Torrubiella] hemipterigena]|uniref:Protein required for cell viability Rrp17 n=1 Tax=[Torrubiella] hemipterigena TaxID=1531966 RepID=A0A0A1TSM1_9HYPO|nr:hypothetical protein VHEMI10056 [[Torrubiella] hemipterigena]